MSEVLKEQLIEQAREESPLILVVEDNLDAQQILYVQLKQAGFRIYGAFDGASALTWLEENDADLVLLDWMLPNKTGIDVCRDIRKKHSTTELPILMLSALGEDAAARVRGLQAGANDFMAKPYETTELIARIRVLLNIKQEADRFEDLLSRYTASAVRMQAKIDPSVLKERSRHHAVVIFADLRGFTQLTAHIQPEKTLRLLDEFFDMMMRIIDQHGGIVFDVAGDELLAAFNVPYEVPVSSYLAIRAVTEMQKTFDSLRREWSQNGINVGLGIGMHQGEVVLGNVGGKELMRYTIMGNVVNFAHRLVENAEDGDIIISSEIYKEISLSSDDFTVVPLQDAKLKGITTPQDIYRLRM